MAAGQWFRRGLLINVLNPKAAVFFMAVLPGYIHADASVAGQTMLLSGSYVVIASLVHLAIVLLAAQAYICLQSGRRETFIRRFFAGLLAAVAMWFFVSSG